MKKLIFICFVVFNALNANASKVITNEFTGKESGIKHPVTVILPTSYNEDKQYNVIYVLHGHSGDNTNWTEKTNIERLADTFNVIIVTPNGGYDSWYIDSKIKQNSLYETYIAKDVVSYIDQNYSTYANRFSRAITGLSMGGFGALHIAINNQHVFAAVGAMSAGVDFRPFPNKFGIDKILGNYNEFANEWSDIAIINNLDKINVSQNKDPKSDHKVEVNQLSIRIDIGLSDFFLSINRQLHYAMLAKNIPHEYVEQEGGHTWKYWDTAIVGQFKFLTSTFPQ
ncbi:alpha/beta hydrolase [Thalassotalea profundi]|uniref:Esterase n=1 Tax=Thalassotalea profundi TaxID=2036687 RepID=A0ABQ3IFP8_9GAMM|nr:alpha/beta hydrolase family protein [Thalassotalea profundi]GHE82949.1 esterase [Thalassotalea profundi]